MKPAPAITADELRAKLESTTPLLIIDVMPEEAFAAERIPNARNACVYNVTFLDDVKQLASGFETPIAVYGSSSRNLASATAGEKLLAAGYTQIFDFRGGLEDWRTMGQSCDGDPAMAELEPRPAEGRHEVDLQKSRVEWAGRSLLGAHTGTLKLLSGHIDISDGKPVDAGFTLDMNSIANSDIEDSEMRQVLIHHLESDDFFDVERFPTATFELTQISCLPHANSGTANAQVAGILTMKDVKGDVSFPAILGLTPDGALAADAHFEIDRTLWNVRYGSGKFYEKLGKHLVNDLILLALKIVTVPKT